MRHPQPSNQVKKAKDHEKQRGAKQIGIRNRTRTKGILPSVMLQDLRTTYWETGFVGLGRCAVISHDCFTSLLRVTLLTTCVTSCPCQISQTTSHTGKSSARKILTSWIVLLSLTVSFGDADLRYDGTLADFVPFHSLGPYWIPISPG